VTEVDRALVRRKLATITRNLRDLGPIAEISVDTLRSDRLRQKGVERLLQETVEAAVDTNLHLLRAAGDIAPTDYHTSFIDAGRHGIVSGSLAAALAPAAGLRNRLVHEYDAIDDEIVLAAVREVLRYFTEYVVAVEQYVSGEV